MTVTASSTDTLTVTVDEDEVIDTAQLVDIQGSPYRNSGFPIHNSAGTLQVSHTGTGDWTAITVGVDEPFVMGQAFRFCRLNDAGGSITFFIP